MSLFSEAVGAGQLLETREEHLSPGFSHLLKQKDSAWGEGSLQHSTFLMSFLAKGMGFPFFQLKLLLKEGFVLIKKGMLRDDS